MNPCEVTVRVGYKMKEAECIRTIHFSCIQEDDIYLQIINFFSYSFFRLSAIFSPLFFQFFYKNDRRKYRNGADTNRCKRNTYTKTLHLNTQVKGINYFNRLFLVSKRGLFVSFSLFSVKKSYAKL